MTNSSSDRDARTPRAKAKRPRRNAIDRTTVVSIVVLLAFLSVWQWIVVPVFEINPALLPRPSDIAPVLFDGLMGQALWHHIGITMQEILFGFVCGSAVGFFLAVPVAESRSLERILSPYIVALQAVPKVAIAPLLIIWVGYGLSSKVLIVALITFFPVFVNSVTGLRETPDDQIELMRLYRATRWQKFRFAKIQNALPYIFAGLQVGVTLSVIGAIVGEFVGAQEGLGSLIVSAGFKLDSATVFAAITLLTVLAALLSTAVQFVGHRIVFWAPSSSRKGDR